MRRATPSSHPTANASHQKDSQNPFVRKRQSHPVALTSLVLVVFLVCMICTDYWRLPVEQYAYSSPVSRIEAPSRPIVIAPPKDTYTQREQKSPPKSTTSKKSNCKPLSIYPPDLTPSLLPLESPLCGHVFTPIDFFNSQQYASLEYDWKATGLDYYAAGIGLHHVTFDHGTKHPQHQTPRRHNLIYNSMMKCGSTSVNRALKELAQSAKERLVNQPMTVVYQGKQNNLLVKSSDLLMTELEQYQKHQHQPTNNVTQQQQQQQQQHGDNTYDYFSTVRDPVSRFVSAIAQEMYVRRNDPKAQGFRDKCLLETPKATLGCSIRHVQDFFAAKTALNQPHFIPMTTILYKRAYGHDVKVTLLDIDTVHRLVSQMVAPSRQATWDTQKNKVKAQGSQVLKNMTVANLEEPMIRDICLLYRMDVHMMKTAGFATICP